MKWKRHCDSVEYDLHYMVKQNEHIPICQNLFRVY